MANFDDLPDGVLVVDAAGRVLNANLAFLALTDRGREEAVGQRFEALVAEEDMLHLAGFEALFNAGPIQDCIVIFTASDGGQRPLVVSTALARDRKSLLLTARMAGEVQKELADASRWVVQEQERSINLTEARDALFAKNEALRAAQADLEQAYAKLQNEVATRERLEQELSLARRLEAIGQLSAGVAHEINTPLQYVGDSVHFLGQAFQRITVYLQRVDQLAQQPAPAWADVLSGLQRARKEARLDFVMDEIPRAVQASKEGVEHVSKIVQALKAFSHRGTEEKGASDVNAAIENTLLMTQNEYKSVATARTDLGELPPVCCIISQLNQVLLNLIVNAAHAIADAKRPDLGCITVTSRASGNVVQIDISDDGAGIPEHVRHKIFEQFFTTKEVGRGTGQGLALARQIIVEQHGGTLSFTSEVGKGTTFTLRLPIDGETRLA
ncbi:MAG TPA: ATP-binding protein [Polyangiaceae bacterium]|nr:ATP-binding protein [Polyangiaceae bacterium]